MSHRKASHCFPCRRVRTTHSDNIFIYEETESIVFSTGMTCCGLKSVKKTCSALSSLDALLRLPLPFAAPSNELMGNLKRDLFNRI